MSQAVQLKENLSGTNVQFYVSVGNCTNSEVKQYMTEHSVINLTEENKEVDSIAIAIARLQFALVKTRPELSLLLDESDLVGLLDCFQGEILTSAKIDDMHNILLDYSPSLSLLAKKIERISPLQRLALADIIEVAWHRSGSEQRSPIDIAIALMH